MLPSNKHIASPVQTRPSPRRRALAGDGDYYTQSSRTTNVFANTEYLQAKMKVWTTIVTISNNPFKM